MLTQVNQLTNLELRRLNDAGAAPAWFPKKQEVWIAAMNHVSHHSLATASSTRRFVLPPIHLFWGGNKNTQQLFYYHFSLSSAMKSNTDAHVMSRPSHKRMEVHPQQHSLEVTVAKARHFVTGHPI